MEDDPEALPLRTQAALLGLSRASLYYQPVPPSPEEVALKHRIDAIYTAHPFYGSRRLTVLLSEEFGPINRKRVQRYSNLTRVVKKGQPCYHQDGVVAKRSEPAGYDDDERANVGRVPGNGT